MPSPKELAKALAYQGEIRNTSRNRLLGGVADVLSPVSEFADQYKISDRIPFLGGMSAADLTGLKGAQSLVNDMSYGKSPISGASLQTTKVDPRVLDLAGVTGAMMPVAKSLGKAALREGARQIETGTGIGRAVVDPRSPITTWHGSPHAFPPTANNPLGEFDPMKVGTGEGAQAYGVGAGYLAEAKGLAEGYRNALGHKGALDLEYESGKRGIPLSRESRIEFMRQAQPNVSPEKAAKSFQYANSESRNLDQAKLAELFKDYKESKQGNLYKVDLPDEHVAKMLNWDKPMNQQHPDVQRAFNYKAAEMPSFTVSETGHPNPQYKYSASGFSAAPTPEAALKEAKDSVNSSEWFNGVSGEKAYRAMVEKIGATAASKKLAQSGITGIRYLDAASRDAAGKGTSNFVVFDPKHMNILERNGVGGAMMQRPKTEFEILHDTAQKNAALPKDKGGLGLPANNTYIDRAGAMAGLTAEDAASRAHQVGNLDFTNIPISEFKGKLVHKSPSYNGRQSSEYRIGEVGGDPVYMRKANHWGRFGTNIKEGDNLANAFADINGISDDQFGRVGSLGNQWNINGPIADKINALKEQRKLAEPFSQEATAIFEKMYPLMKKSQAGYIPIDNLVGRLPEKIASFNTFDAPIITLPNGQIRSRFAAFDPMRRHEADILAGVGVGGMLDPQAIAEALRQQDRK